MPMNTIQGDLLQLADAGQFDLIVHGCNCYCTMGAGIAKYIKLRWPEAYKSDCATAKGDKEKIGSYSAATVVTIAGTELIIINAYTQHHWKGRGVLAAYPAIQSVFQQVASNYPKARIGYPKIGAGLAKGDWAIISNIIDTALDGLDHTLVEYAPDKLMKEDGASRRP